LKNNGLGLDADECRALAGIQTAKPIAEGSEDRR
jgi:hypothetical protein